MYERSIKKGETLKVGVNKNLDISFVHKRALYGLEDIAKVSFGGSVSGILNKDIKTKHGVEVAINL